MISFVSSLGGASLAYTSAFNGARLSGHTTTISKARFSMEANPSVPFLEHLSKLDGSVPVDAGFDPNLRSF